MAREYGDVGPCLGFDDSGDCAVDAYDKAAEIFERFRSEFLLGIRRLKWRHSH